MTQELRQQAREIKKKRKEGKQTDVEDSELSACHICSPKMQHTSGQEDVPISPLASFPSI